jgi:signal transduction histidine kinase
MRRDLEDRIQQLCAQVVATDEEEELNRLCVELRDALNKHISRLREQVAAYRASSIRRAPVKGE